MALCTMHQHRDQQHLLQLLKHSSNNTKENLTPGLQKTNAICNSHDGLPRGQQFSSQLHREKSMDKEATPSPELQPLPYSQFQAA
ncbi:hypothetical protein Nepgr_019569 [Nepenthes gracilis]|uniref:Uncharacterized protein n=1 Tax=Nepenthes gracilis TaxID=150966 RepID=A0AAD3XUH8_NEPGR|nr:hypothetical protein Nepgr_019569 [Nepenthes gracilis]